MALGEFLESQGSRMSGRFELFSQAKALYVSYTAELSTRGVWSFPRLGSAEFVRAAADPRLHQAEALFLEALRLSLQEGAFRDASIALFEIGMMLHITGRVIDAEKRFREALDIAESLPQMTVDDIKTVSGCYYHLGILLARRGELLEGRRCLEQSLKADRACLDIGGETMTREAIMDLYPEA